MLDWMLYILSIYGLNEKEAFEVESALIDCYLINLTNIKLGYGRDYGVTNALLLDKELSRENHHMII